MKKCTEFEIKLSEVLDGELKKDEFPGIMEHIAKCEDCREIFLGMSALKARVREFEGLDHEDLIPSDHIWKKIAAQTGFQDTTIKRYLHFWPIVPGLAALFLFIFFGLGVQKLFFPEMVSDSNLTVTLEENSGKMTERHFVKIVQELIQSERKYQYEMLRVMKEVVQIYPGDGSSEGDFSTEQGSQFELSNSQENSSSSIGS